MTDKIKVVIFNSDEIKDPEFDRFDITYEKNGLFANKVISEIDPHVIISFGSLNSYKLLLSQPLYIRQRWLHIEEPISNDNLFNAIIGCYSGLIKNNANINEPVISVITATYNTEDIWWPYRSLVGQEYKNWEWIVYDDGSSDENTLHSISQLSSIDPRVKVFFASHSGSIGEVKKNAFSLASGEYLVELDHDDELTPWALGDVYRAFQTYPDSGFCYSDCAEVVGDQHDSASYPDGWGFGYGSYRTEVWRGRDYLVTNYPDINSKTIRHIVGVPNHFRAWRRDFYHSIGGHNKNLFVADDYELLVRTFLHTKIVHIQKFGYIQYHHKNNTQKKRNAEIQNLVALIHQVYEGDIHQRFLDLEVDDFMWRDGMLDWNIENPEETPIANYLMR
jgi:glycosyltransferase involved in cell wall biosynthesis